MEIVYEKTYADAMDAIIKKTSCRTVDLGIRHLIIVPDIYTFMLEKRLFLAGSGSFDLEVTTFNRLYQRLITDKKALSKQGALMLLKRLCRVHASELVCFSRSALRPGFALKLYDVFNTLSACSVSPEELAGAEGMLKAADIALLYREYLDETRDKYVDAAGRTRILTETAEKSGLFKDCHVYVALYDAFTAQLKKLLDVIDSSALSLTVAAPPVKCDCEVTAPVEIMGCPDAPAEYKEAAKRIRWYAYNGGRYGDVCLIDERGEYDTVRRIFDEYGIPYYAEKKLPLSGTELARFVFAALEAKRRGCRTEDMLSLARNYYVGAEKSDADEFCNYTLSRCVDYLGFSEEFTPGGTVEEESAAAAERVRARLAALLNELNGCFDGSAEFASSLKRLLERSGARERTEELAKADGRNLTGVYDKAIELIELFSALYSGENCTPEELIDVLTEGFAGTEISLLPNLSDTVQIGPLAQFRGQRPKFAVIAGFNDGVIPAYMRDEGLLSDAEAGRLESYKVKLEPRIEEKNALCRLELWQLLHSCERLFITYSQEDGQKPAYDLKLLAAKNASASHALYSDYYGQAFAEETAPDLIARRLGSRFGALETLLTRGDLKFSPSVAAALSDEYLRYFSVKRDAAFLSPDKGLFFRDGATSVSALQTYFQCPYMYFMRYGLKLSKADDGKVTPVDVGLLLHKVVELFVDEDMPSDVETFVRAAVQNELDTYQKYKYRANERIFAQVVKEAEVLCRVVAGQIAAGSFKPFMTEASFGKENSKLKTVCLPGGIRLMGEIDRIDLYKDFARVIDYKTGQTHFSYSDLYFGRKIQLMIYMRVLIENGYRPAGFFYFPFSVSWRDDEFSHRLTGAFNASEEILYALDNSLAYGGKSAVIEASVKADKTGALKLNKTGRACAESRLAALSEYAEAVAGRAAEEIASGCIIPSPAESGGRRACAFCDYAAVCGAEAAGRRCDGVGADEIEAAVKGNGLH